MTTEEIRFFDTLSDSWDEHETQSTPTKVKEVLGFADIKEGMKILDLGTGTGVLVPFLSAMVGPSGSVKAIDISEGMLGKARQKYGSLPNVGFEKIDFEKEAVKGQYDRILLYCVYPHLHTPEETLRRLAEDNLAPGGRIIIAFPTDENFINDIHREKKAESDLLPPAPVLAARIGSWGLTSRALACSPSIYVVAVCPS